MGARVSLALLFAFVECVDQISPQSLLLRFNCLQRLHTPGQRDNKDRRHVKGGASKEAHARAHMQTGNLQISINMSEKHIHKIGKIGSARTHILLFNSLGNLFTFVWEGKNHSI